jgi:hypothetical protein
MGAAASGGAAARCIAVTSCVALASLDQVAFVSRKLRRDSQIMT